MQLYDCNGSGAQKWTTSNGELIKHRLRQCLDATDYSSANGNQLQIWTCAGSDNQKWNLPA